jgi:ABC-type lipoprotein release transport system permease subunit
VGIAGVVLSMAINNGMLLQMVETAIRTEVGHLQIHARGYEANPGLEINLADGGREAARILDSVGGVQGWAPRVRSEALVFSPRASAGVRLVGIDPDREAGVSLLAQSIADGSYLDGNSRGVLIGQALGRRLKVGLGGKIVISVQDLDGDLAGAAFRVSGVFQTASREFDQGTVFAPIGETQKLLHLGEAVSELVIVVAREGDLETIRHQLAARLGTAVEVNTWKDIVPLLVQMIDVLDSSAWYVYAAVFIAMVFGIANVLLMAVYERMREIGVVMALGMKRGRIATVVVLESVILTFLGLFLGYGAAMVIVALLSDGIDLSRFAEGLTAYGIGTHIVPVIRSQDVSIPVFSAVVTAFVASLWPALRATRFHPAEAVRHG